MPVTRKRKRVNQTQSQSSQPARAHLEFSTVTKFQALHRQWNRCAHCGKHLSLQVGHAHHVIAVRSNNLNNLDDTFLRSVDNCVILCNHCCDLVGHSGNIGNNAITSLSAFKYSHGLEKNEHYQWDDKVSVEHNNYRIRKSVTVLSSG